MITFETAQELDDLPVGSVVIIKESEFGDHVAWQKTDHILDHIHHNMVEDDDIPKEAWASVYYHGEHDAIDLLNMSYNNVGYIVYTHPSR